MNEILLGLDLGTSTLVKWMLEPPSLSNCSTCQTHAQTLQEQERKDIAGLADSGVTCWKIFSL